MILITCPNNNLPEREYAIRVLFSDLFGIDENEYTVQFQDNTTVYSILVNDRRIVVEDHFFNLYPEPLSYLRADIIPKELTLFHGSTPELPIIFGVDKFEKKGNVCIIGLDVFASIFFMLTRWEEVLLGREEKGDCDEGQLFSVKHGIYGRPIVNEYAVFMKGLLPLGCSTSNREFEVVLSHDVDGFLTPSWKRIVKDCIKQTVHGAPKNTVLNLTWKEEIKYRRAFPNPLSQFGLYTSLSERYNISEWFYLKVCSKGEKEATYLFNDKQTVLLVSWLKTKLDQKPVIGFHPSQSVFGNERQWMNELSRIIWLLGDKPIIGRNHHLLYSFDTLRSWELISDSPLHISNCVFHKRQGFRSGMCSPYRLFDVFHRRVMNLIEHPCQIMDTVIRYDINNKSDEVLWSEIKGIIDTVRKFHGELVLTWHIYIRNQSIISDYYQWCKRVVQYAVKD